MFWRLLMDWTIFLTLTFSRVQWMPMKAVAKNGSSFIFNMQFNLIKWMKKKYSLFDLPRNSTQTHWRKENGTWNPSDGFVHPFSEFHSWIYRNRNVWVATIKCFHLHSTVFKFVWFKFCAKVVNFWHIPLLQMPSSTSSDRMHYQ